MPVERRRTPRQVVSRPCKVLDVASARFSEGRTIDASDCGALVEVRGARPLRVGDRVRLGIDWREAGVVAFEDLVPARVVRVESTLDGCVAAVALDR